MSMKNEKTAILAAGALIGILASLLVLFGNPVNMGFCIACFLRDTAGALGLHSAANVQYIRPEIIGLVLGSLLLACLNKEFHPRGGSAPLTRFVLGFFVMIGCLVFLGCPFRMILRLAGGDLNAFAGLAGFVCGILIELVYTAAAALLVFGFAEQIMGLFVGQDSVEVISLGTSYLRIISFLYLLSGSGNIVQGFFRGIGDLSVTLMSSLLNISIRVLAVFLMLQVSDGGFGCLAWACGFGWLAMNLLEIPLLVRRIRGGKLLE